MTLMASPLPYQLLPMRKNLFSALIVLLLPCISMAQALSTSPLFPQDTSKIVIEADFSKGNRGLFNYGNTNDVYVHIGLITSESANAGDWKYVRFGWGTTNDTASAVSLGNNR